MAIKTKLNPMGANGATPVSYYTLTVTSNIDSAQCTLTYDGVSHSSRTATVPEGTVINCSMYASGYGTTYKNITMDSDKTWYCQGNVSSTTYEVWSYYNYTSPTAVTSNTAMTYSPPAASADDGVIAWANYSYNGGGTNFANVVNALNGDSSNYFTYGSYAPADGRSFYFYFSPNPYKVSGSIHTGITHDPYSNYKFKLSSVSFSYQYGKKNNANSAVVYYYAPSVSALLKSWTEAYSAGKVDFTINVGESSYRDLTNKGLNTVNTRYYVCFTSFSSGTSSSGGSNYLRLTKFSFTGSIGFPSYNTVYSYYWTTTVTNGTTNSSSSGGNVGCVLYNTDILLADNTTKQAQEIKIGDVLQTYNEGTQEFEPNRVLAVLPNKKRDIIKVTFNDNTFVNLTSGHPFLTQKGWASYDNDKTVKEKLYEGAELYQLEIGDKCLAQDGTFKAINSIERDESELADVYDFTIENAHTFIGNNCVLHNATTGS